MNDWHLTSQTEQYKGALIATNSIEESAVGFAKPSEVSQKATSIILKQNNTIIQLLVKISEDIADCREAISDIKRVVADKSSAGTSSDISKSIADLQKNFQKLSLGDPVKPKSRPIGPLFVYKDPLKIFEEEKKKLRDGLKNTNRDGKSKALNIK